MNKSPLSTAIYRYRAKLNAYLVECLEAEGSDGHIPISYRTEMEAIEAWIQPAEDRGSAILALELALEDYDIGDTPRIPAMMKAALDWLKSQSNGAPAVAETSNPLTGQILEAQDALSSARNIVEAAYMAAHAINDKVKMNAMATALDIATTKLNEVASMLDLILEDA